MYVNTISVFFKLHTVYYRTYNAIINWNNVLNKLIVHQFYNNNAGSILNNLL